MSYARRTFGGWAERRAMRQAAEEVGGEVVVARTDTPSVAQPLVVQLPFRYTALTLDIVNLDDGGIGARHRLRAAFHNANGLKLRLRGARLRDRIALWLGVRASLVGSRSFDQRFAIRSSAPMQVRRVFEEGRVRSIIFAQPDMTLETSDGSYWLEPLPTGVALLECTIPAAAHPQPLVRLFELFQLLLPRLELPELPDEDEVQGHIRTLRGPGGFFRDDGLLLWRGEEALQDAASALAALGDARAVEALVAALERGDPALKARACEALGRIGHARAVSPVVRMLGKDGAHEGRPLRAWAQEALHALGEGPLADAVLDALKGHPERVEGAMGGRRQDVLHAFAESLSSASGHHAATALAQLDAVEVLPEMREALRLVGEESPRGVALTAAIRELEARAALPRPAASPDSTEKTLPRPAGEPGPDTGGLPRPAEER